MAKATRVRTFFAPKNRWAKIQLFIPTLAQAIGLLTCLCAHIIR